MLPIHDIEADLRASLQNTPSRFLLKAPTGSGKSTTVPSIVHSEICGRQCADEGSGRSASQGGKVLVIQPRRMACRLLAEYVSTLEKSPLGQKVGYTVRFDNKTSADTQILFMTDGVLQRLLLDNPDLSGISAVLFDEFHERRLSSDLALARVLELQDSLRPDLHLGVMSATLKLKGLEDYLNPCTALETGGRLFPVEIAYRSPEGHRPAPQRALHSKQRNQRDQGIWDQVATAARDEAPAQPEGTRILVFLPGLHEIRKSQSALESLSALRDWEILPLYSALPPAQQKAAIAPSSSRRIILATNVAETSLTIAGVTVVIDSGLHRTNLFDPRRGIDSLRIEKISQASAEQRAGRAGRTAPGRAIRLWSEPDHHGRPAFETPEIHRIDLCEAVLFLKRLGQKNVSGQRCADEGNGKSASPPFRWLDSPDSHMLAQAESLLRHLGALDAEGDITETGYEMSRWPMHPRLARLLSAGVEEGCLAETAFIAAAIGGEGLFKKGGHGPKWNDFAEKGDLTDFAAEWRALASARHARFHPGQCNTLGILARGARETDKAYDQYLRLLEKRGLQPREVSFHQNGEAVTRALLHAFGDRLATHRDSGSTVCHLIGGRKGKLDPKSIVKRAELFLATEIIEIEGKERTVNLSRCASITEEQLAALFPDEITSTATTQFDDISRRIIASSQRTFRGLVLSEKSGGHLNAADLDSETAAQAAQILSQKAHAGELVLKKWDGSVERWINRLNFLTQAMPELELPGFSNEDHLTVLEELCHQGTLALSYRDLKDRDPWPILRDWLSAPQRAALESYAPESITLANGKKAKLSYPNKTSDDSPIEPSIAMRAQHLFGVENTPTIANGHPILIKILAPSQRPYQTTKDLPSFWKSGFAQMKKELASRYPKHPWDLPS